jgi:hypothetical protein
MSSEVKALLQQINFIETDMELHKQILLSIPSNNKEEIAKTIKKIADQKNQISELRNKIKEIDKTEYDKIIAIEQSVEKFKQISAKKKFIAVNTLNESGECYITLSNGKRIDCLVAAKEENGNYTILTIDGETKEYPSDIVQ